jgi:chromosomal replication initiation ATPase DnaA
LRHVASGDAEKQAQTIMTIHISHTHLTPSPVSSHKLKAAVEAGADRARAQFIIDLVAMATGVTTADIISHTRNHMRAARARQMAMYLAYVAYSWPLARVGRAFGRDRTTAGYACRLIEDLRDDRAFDVRLNELEACLSSAPAPHAVDLGTGFSALAYAGKV